MASFSSAISSALIDTATLRDRSERRLMGRAAFVGLTYTFGSAPRQQQRQRDPGFDFQGGETPGA